MKMTDHLKPVELIRHAKFKWRSHSINTNKQVLRVLAIDPPALALNNHQTMTQTLLVINGLIWGSVMLTAYGLFMFVWRPAVEQALHPEVHLAIAQARFSRALVEPPVADYMTISKTEDWSTNLAMAGDSLFVVPVSIKVSESSSLGPTEQGAEQNDPVGIEASQTRKPEPHEKDAPHSSASQRANLAQPSATIGGLQVRIVMTKHKISTTAIDDTWQRAQGFEARGQLDAAKAIYEAILLTDGHHLAAQQALLRINQNAKQSPLASNPDDASNLDNASMAVNDEDEIP